VLVDLTERGTARAVDWLLGFGERADGPKPAFERVADDLRAAQRVQFLTGAGWARDKPSTVRQKKAKGQPARVMVATGAAERSYTVKGAPGAVARITRTQLTFGSSLYYLRFQTKKRPPIRATRAMARQAAVRFVNWIVEEAR
jgi:hypothetical protein